MVLEYSKKIRERKIKRAHQQLENDAKYKGIFSRFAGYPHMLPELIEKKNF
jgi:hypothetical protein